MKVKLRLKDLCCANCAAKIEDKMSKVDGVESVTVNFLAEKMILELAEDKLDEILNKAEKIVHKIEPDVKIQRI